MTRAAVALLVAALMWTSAPARAQTACAGGIDFVEGRWQVMPGDGVGFYTDTPTVTEPMPSGPEAMAFIEITWLPSLGYGTLSLNNGRVAPASIALSRSTVRPMSLVDLEEAMTVLEPDTRFLNLATRGYCDVSQLSVTILTGVDSRPGRPPVDVTVIMAPLSDSLAWGYFVFEQRENLRYVRTEQAVEFLRLN